MEMMDYAEEMNKSNSKFCVAWLPDGNSFLVRDPAEFTRSVIPKFFKQSKFQSFARKLYRWGFRQFTSKDVDGTSAPLDAVAFSAPCFKRDAKHELINMKSNPSSEKKRKTTGNDLQGRVCFISTKKNGSDNGDGSSTNGSPGRSKRQKTRESSISPVSDDSYLKEGKISAADANNEDNHQACASNYASINYSNMKPAATLTATSTTESNVSSVNAPNSTFNQNQAANQSANNSQPNAALQALLNKIVANNGYHLHQQQHQTNLNDQHVRHISQQFQQSQGKSHFQIVGSALNSTQTNILAHQAMSLNREALFRQVMASGGVKPSPQTAHAPVAAVPPATVNMTHNSQSNPNQVQQNMSLLANWLGQNMTAQVANNMSVQAALARAQVNNPAVSQNNQDLSSALVLLARYLSGQR